MAQRNKKLSNAAARIIAAIITGLFALATGLITGFLFARSNPTAFPGPGSTVTSTAKSTGPTRSPVQAHPTATVTVTVSVSGSAPAPETPVRTYYLDELEPVEDELEPGSVELGGKIYSRSLINRMASCSEVGPVDWLVPAGVDRFIAHIGVPGDAAEPEARVSFNVYRNGAPTAIRETLGVGASKEVTVEVAAGDRIRLESVLDEERRGNCNTEARAVWGDARVE